MAFFSLDFHCISLHVVAYPDKCTDLRSYISIHILPYNYFLWYKNSEIKQSHTSSRRIHGKHTNKQFATPFSCVVVAAASADATADAAADADFFLLFSPGKMLMYVLIV